MIIIKRCRKLSNVIKNNLEDIISLIAIFCLISGILILAMGVVNNYQHSSAMKFVKFRPKIEFYD